MKPLLLASLALLLAAAPATRPATRPAAVPIDRQCDQLLARWATRFEKEKFSSAIAAPFVIATDRTPAHIARYRDATILPAHRALKAMFVRTDLPQPVLILLIHDPDTYQRLAGQWLGDDDPPHFGFFRHDGIMCMNISTGAGTLVHELTHAIVKPDFPDIPDWFNEGLASLYEQSFIRDNAIRGVENWRLPYLQRAIGANKLRSLEDLLADRDFYAKDRSNLNYAQARYLMFYLQEKNLLKEFYTRFRAAAKDDPTGLATLKALIAPQSLPDFETTWRNWAMNLKYAG